LTFDEGWKNTWSLMRSKILPAIALFLPTLAGLGVSAILLVDYVRASPVFCAEGGGCQAVRQTPLAMPFGVPMPMVGLIGFACLGGLCVSRGKRVRAVHCAIGLFATSVAVGLIAAQLWMGDVCVYCMTADISACAVGAAAFWRFRGRWDMDVSMAVRIAAGAVLVLTPTVLLVLGFLWKAGVPSVIAREMRRTPKGLATVVEFVDFECPYCRMEQDELKPMLEAEKRRVHVVRKLVPLARIHPHAMDAARAACCGEALGMGDAMADALFRAPVEKLTRAGCEKIAKDLGLDEARFASCIADPNTDARIAADRRTFDGAASKGDGLPLLWIGDKKVMGAEEPSALRRALDEAIAKTGL
jgi:uncharacterized membrane protein/predicted DsbA family dithiol-disulfide isomerase